MLYQFEDNGRGFVTLDTDHVNYDRLCDLLGLRKEKDRKAVQKVIEAYELFVSQDSVKPFLSKEEIVTNGKIDFTYFTDDKLAVDSEGKLSFGENNSFTQLMNRLVEYGLLERTLREEKRFGNRHDKPVYCLNPRKLLELSQ